jgi:histidine decarboxylase
MVYPRIDAASRNQLETLITQSEQEYQRFIGFPAAFDFDYAELAPLMTMFMNNIGDPDVDAFHGAQTKAFEREVIKFCADLFRAPSDNYWGYVTNGSTECNLFALYLAREKLQKPIVYYSAAAHYSIPKNIRLLAMDSQQVQAQPSGEMNYEHLKLLVAQHPDTPAIVVATIGTTMTEARDNVRTIKDILMSANVSHYIHADAALAGFYAALLEPHTPFDFQDGADSVSISGHKFIGSPIPCGVIITKKTDIKYVAGGTNYTGSIDTTISGSRNGHTPLYLWYAIKRFGIEGFRDRGYVAQQMAAYAHERLTSIGWETWRNPHALTIMLSAPPENIIRKWQLATHEGWSHIICMPGVTKEQIDSFITDISPMEDSLTLSPASISAIAA